MYYIYILLSIIAIITMIIIFKLLFTSVSKEKYISDFPYFKVEKDVFLLVDIILKDNTLILTSHYYKNKPFDFQEVIVTINHKLLTDYKDIGEDELEPCREIIYKVPKEFIKDSNNVIIKYKNIEKTFIIKTEKNEKKDDLVVATLFKDDYYLIPFFYNYYKLQGVSKFLLYYNGEKEKVEDKLYKNDGIEYYYWNYKYFDRRENNHKHHAQVMFLNHIKNRYMHKANYIILNDLDEYMYIPETKLIDYIKRNNKLVYMFLNNFCKIPKLEINKNKINIIKEDKIYSPCDRSKCIYSSKYKGFFQIHHPKKSKEYYCTNNVFFHIKRKNLNGKTKQITINL